MIHVSSIDLVITLLPILSVIVILPYNSSLSSSSFYILLTFSFSLSTFSLLIPSIMAATPDDNNINGFLSGWGLTLTPHPCDACHVAAALLYCKADSAFFCGPCDAKIHPPTRFPKHERVWVCEVCEQSPAVVDCKADSAALCSSCDHDIHSANPLSRRHERVPVTPFLDSPIDAASSRSTSGTAVTSAFLVPDPVPTLCPGLLNDTPGDEADAWLIPNPSSSFLYNESDILNFVYNNGTNIANYPAFKQIQEQDTKPAVAAVTKNLTYSTTTKVTDSVGPTQSQGNANNSNLAPIIGAETLFESCFNIDFTQPNKPPKKNDNNNNNNNACLSPSFNYSVSSSETGVVPDGNASSMSSEVSYSFATSTVSVEGGVPVTDREARVLRYREKRKNRKFQKTIRYASRKAYAETRPRVKGRFAKRTDSNETSGIDFAVDNR